MSRQSGATAVSELLQRSKLNTTIDGLYTIHQSIDFNDRGQHGVRQEYWKKGKILGRGGGGEVRLETNSSSNQLRAVKKLSKRTNSRNVDYTCELEALLHFSQQEVSVESGPYNLCLTSGV